MTKATKLIIGLIAFAGIMGFTLSTNARTAQAHGNEDHSKVAQASQQQPKNDSEAKDFTYTARQGDSYTVLARKAIQTHGINNNVNLSGAQIIFAETNLTQEAGSPLLEVGQKVTITQEDVSNWVKKAQQMTKAQQAAWQPYVSTVDFNTNNNG